jgi:hypothetical protein
MMMMVVMMMMMIMMMLMMMILLLPSGQASAVLNLTEQQKQLIKILIENATTRDQIDHIEKQLKVCLMMMMKIIMVISMSMMMVMSMMMAMSMMMMINDKYSQDRYYNDGDSNSMS